MEFAPYTVLASEHNEAINSISISSNGRYIGSADSEGKVVIWSVQQKTVSHRYRDSCAVLCTVWSICSQSSLLTWGNERGTLSTMQMLEAQGLNGIGVPPTNVKLRCFTAHSSAIEYLSTNPSRFCVHGLASAGRSEVRVWMWDNAAGWRDNVRIDLASWLAVSNPGHSTLPSVIVTGLAWQPNITTDHQRLLISCLHHGVSCWQWDGDQGLYQLVWCIPLANCGSLSISSAPREPNFAVQRIGFGFEIYDLRTCLRQQVLNFLRPIDEKTYMCIPSVYLDDGLFILTGSTCGKIRLWHAASADHMQTYRHNGNPIQAIAVHFNPAANSYLLVVGTSQPGSSNDVHVWICRK